MRVPKPIGLIPSERLIVWGFASIKIMKRSHLTLGFFIIMKLKRQRVRRALVNFH